ncbi:3-methyladenine DNA glycosylase/8-oxoguanine DNAglycosylase [Halorhabdus sp. SVX81]|uniref:DNA-3-methyladenine glycosylase family protein n=1 Tax=Halorhabdus sp. SVX81 TaxID=2978283 RepID=UPI0023DAAA83|nr:DNA glycosylase [Halorhabdus sp. SVX81]WEL16973.1 3-methyladenine DNA glycosylase/8-oxoguanine DNAglycosylase [Halorhabdus sp. SVX81]
MNRGTLSLSSVAFDLQSTVESGQSFRWTRLDGQMYETSNAYGGDAWYATVIDNDGGLSEGDHDIVRVRQVDDRLEWEASFEAEATLRRRLRLDDDLAEIRDATPADPLLEAAFDRYWGLRLVQDPPFATLIAFICSAQMRIGRIHEMQRALEERFGEVITFDGEEYHAFPTPGRLAEATEGDLRDLGLGYRAPYVQRTAEMVAEGTAHPQEATDLAYEDAREYLTRFVGVGEKVADCVLLFSLGFVEAVPLDTWIRSTIEEYYPECDRGSYAETSRAIRERFGGQYAGYAQTYVFHHLRNGGGSTE